MAEQTIGAGYVKALIELAELKGANRSMLIERSQINPTELEDRDTRIPLANYKTLMNAAQELCDEPALALLLGEAAVFAEMSIVGLICLAAETMGDAFLQANRLGRLVVEVDGHRPEGRFEIRKDGDELWLVDTRANPNNFPELTESAFAMMLSWRAHGLTESFGRAVHFTHPEPKDRTEYDRVFQMPIVFGSDKNAILFDESLLSLKLSDANNYVFGILNEHAEALLQSLENSKSMKGQVESLLIPILHTGDISMDLIAEKLGLSRQTLYRKLKAEDTSYEKLLDDLRHQMALDYLDGRKVSVNETAYLVGFSEPSAFSRAFKRWTGHSPSVKRS